MQRIQRKAVYALNVECLKGKNEYVLVCVCVACTLQSKDTNVFLYVTTSHACEFMLMKFILPALKTLLK